MLSVSTPRPCCNGASRYAQVIHFCGRTDTQLGSSCPNGFLFYTSLPLPSIRTTVGRTMCTLSALNTSNVGLTAGDHKRCLNSPTLSALVDMLGRQRTIMVLRPRGPIPIGSALVTTAPLTVCRCPTRAAQAIIGVVIRGIPTHCPGVQFIVPRYNSFLPLTLPQVGVIRPTVLTGKLVGSVS